VWVGFWRVEVCPSPKVQDHAVGFSEMMVDDVSVNWTFSGFGHCVTNEKSAAGEHEAMCTVREME
jgi:hypothetical protein